MNDVQKKIMDECVKQFIENDFRDVTMDSIAKQLGISKKTVYENFTSKENLFVKSMEAYTEKTSGFVDRAVANYTNPYMQLLWAMFFMFFKVKVGYSKIMSLKIAYPQIMEKLLKHRESFIRHYLLDKLKKSQKQGYVVDDVDAEFIVSMLFFGDEFLETMTPTFGVLDKKFELFQLKATKFFCLLRGIATDKGLIECCKFYSEINEKGFAELQYDNIVKNKLVKETKKQL